jgi:hypothetical protein
VAGNGRVSFNRRISLGRLGAQAGPEDAEKILYWTPRSSKELNALVSVHSLTRRVVTKPIELRYVRNVCLLKCEDVCCGGQRERVHE